MRAAGLPIVALAGFGLLTPMQATAQVQGGGTAQLQGVESIPETRLVEIRRDPEAPAFGEVFDLHFTLRLRPGLTAFLPDTLIPTEAVESWAPGGWRTEPAPGDSVDIHATYPVIGYREGRVEYPWIELRFRPAGPGETGDGLVQRAWEVPEGVRGEMAGRLLRLGGVELEAFPPMAETGLSLPPRPPADVRGAGWSFWLLLASVLVVIATTTGAALAGRSWWGKRKGALLAHSGRRSARQTALLELERIRELGWHRNGRVDEFYLSSSNTLRRFASEIEPVWGPELTSRELLARLRDRWGAEQVASLAASVDVAERVKFGGYRPEPDTAEADWRAIRDWIREAPDP